MAVEQLERESDKRNRTSQLVVTVQPCGYGTDLSAS